MCANRAPDKDRLHPPGGAARALQAVSGELGIPEPDLAAGLGRLQALLPDAEWTCKCADLVGGWGSACSFAGWGGGASGTGPRGALHTADGCKLVAGATTADVTAVCACMRVCRCRCGWPLTQSGWRGTSSCCGR